MYAPSDSCLSLTFICAPHAGAAPSRRQVLVRAARRASALQLSQQHHRCHRAVRRPLQCAGMLDVTIFDFVAGVEEKKCQEDDKYYQSLSTNKDIQPVR